MKLTVRFGIVATVCVFQVVLLVTGILLGARFVQKIQNYQKLGQDCQYGLVDMTNYLNMTVFYGIELNNAADNWREKLIFTNKNFNTAKTDISVSKFFSKEFEDGLKQIDFIWSKVLGLVNPFYTHFDSLQNHSLSQEIHDFVQRNGIIAAAEKFSQDKEIQSLKANLILIQNQMHTLIQYVTQLQDQTLIMNQIIAKHVGKFQVWYVIFIVILGLIFVMSMYISILNGARRVILNVKRVQNLSSKLAEKDFTADINPHGSNEMKSLMKNMNGMITEINNFFIVVKKTAARAISSGYSINDASVSTAAATNQINASIEKISKKFEEINESLLNAVYANDEINSLVKTLVSNNSVQSSAIDESAEAVSVMADTIVDIRENAEKRTFNAEEMKQLVSDGDEKISATNKILEEVVSQLDEIGEIITIIDNISEQTNLLSMNAAIESAHAGEFGKGFAVVAEEIRILAESTAENAQKIKNSVSGIIQKVSDAAQSSRSVETAFEKVSKHSSEVIDSLKIITKGIEHIDNQTKEINRKTDVTSSAADKINEYCANLDLQQETVSKSIFAVSELFQTATDSIKKISSDTEAIVKRMSAVGNLSKESYKNMTDLENILEQFKTTSDDSEEVKKEVAGSQIENIISPELQQMLAEENSQIQDGNSDTDRIEFDLDNIEEYQR